MYIFITEFRNITIVFFLTITSWFLFLYIYYGTISGILYNYFSTYILCLYVQEVLAHFFDPLSYNVKWLLGQIVSEISIVIKIRHICLLIEIKYRSCLLFSRANISNSYDFTAYSAQYLQEKYYSCGRFLFLVREAAKK